jgi:polyphosphate glucokinase
MSPKAPSRSRARRKRASSSGPTTLSIDIGGSHIKGSVLDSRGRMLHERVRVDTPDDLTPSRLVQIIAGLAKQLGRFDRVSVGFPGVVRHGVLRTAANLGTERFRGFNLESALRKKLRKPVRVENDADVQGFGAIKGKGVEMVITLGTGFGSAMFVDGELGPHLELAHHCFRKGKTYEQLLGEDALDRQGDDDWNEEVERAIDSLRQLTSFDHLYIGGGNARRLTIKLPSDVTVVSNDAGIWGGVRLWKH